MLEALAGAYAEGATGCTDMYLTGKVPANLTKPLTLSYFAETITKAQGSARRIRECVSSVNEEPTWAEKLTGVYSQFDTVSNETIQYILHRRATAVVLAVQLYRHRNGSYPTAIEQLVPEYLPEIPTDPRSSTGKRFEYLLLDAGRRPVIVAPGDSSLPYASPGPKLQRPKSGAATFPASVLYIDASRWESAADRGRDPDKPDREGDQHQTGGDAQAK
jgi:hypothetical protein